MSQDYDRIEQAIRYIESHVRQQPSLEEIASCVGLSPFHFQRLFRRWAGVSPKRFMEYLTVNYAKQLLDDRKSILDASYDVGLSGSGRLHDHFVTLEAITPGEYKKHGKGLRIYYGMHQSPFGNMFLAQTERGICALSFVSQEFLNKEISALHQQWPNAKFIKDDEKTKNISNKIFDSADGGNEKIHLTVSGTNFQVNVWKALLKIPSGSIATYKQIAEYIGKPNAFRAVATANASNSIGFLIPCHRVLRGSGDLAGYHWGLERKRAMIGWEMAKKELNVVAPKKTVNSVLPESK